MLSYVFDKFIYNKYFIVFSSLAGLITITSIYLKHIKKTTIKNNIDAKINDKAEDQFSADEIEKNKKYASECELNDKKSKHVTFKYMFSK